MARAFSKANTEYFQATLAPISAEPVTMACWFKTADVTTTTMIGSIGRLGRGGWQLWCDGAASSDPLKAAKVDTGGGTSAASKTGISVNTWHHGAGTFASTASRYAFLDGVKSSQNTQNRGGPTVTHTWIGARYHDAINLPFDGSIAEFAIWDVILADAEITILAAGYSPLFVRPGSLACYVPGLLGSGDEQDIVSGATFTDTNTVTADDHPRIIRPSAQIIPFPTAAGGAATVMNQFQGPNLGADLMNGTLM